jgi:hypothetical protein
MRRTDEEAHVCRKVRGFYRRELGVSRVETQGTTGVSATPTQPCASRSSKPARLSSARLKQSTADGRRSATNGMRQAGSICGGLHHAVNHWQARSHLSGHRRPGPRFGACSRVTATVPLTCRVEPGFAAVAGASTRTATLSTMNFRIRQPPARQPSTAGMNMIRRNVIAALYPAGRRRAIRDRSSALTPPLRIVTVKT